MTALEYMQKQAIRHCRNLGREIARGAPQEVIDNIKLKIWYYEQAEIALKKVEGQNA